MAGAVRAGVVDVRTPQNIRLEDWGVRHPTILVCLVTCNWLSNCTTGVFRLLNCFLIEIRDIGIQVVKFMGVARIFAAGLRSIFTSKADDLILVIVLHMQATLLK